MARAGAAPELKPARSRNGWFHPSAINAATTASSSTNLTSRSLRERLPLVLAATLRVHPVAATVVIDRPGAPLFRIVSWPVEHRPTARVPHPRARSVTRCCGHRPPRSSYPLVRGRPRDQFAEPLAERSLPGERGDRAQDDDFNYRSQGGASVRAACPSRSEEASLIARLQSSARVSARRLTYPGVSRLCRCTPRAPTVDVVKGIPATTITSRRLSRRSPIPS